jgi:hypothetical protein
LTWENHSETYVIPIVCFPKAAFNVSKVSIAFFPSWTLQCQHWYMEWSWKVVRVVKWNLSMLATFHSTIATQPTTQAVNLEKLIGSKVFVC